MTDLVDRVFYSAPEPPWWTRPMPVDEQRHRARTERDEWVWFGTHGCEDASWLIRRDGSRAALFDNEIFASFWPPGDSRVRLVELDRWQDIALRYAMSLRPVDCSEPGWRRVMVGLLSGDMGGYYPLPGSIHQLANALRLYATVPR